MLTWIRVVLVKHIKKQHCLLVFDSFKAHLVDNVLQALKRANASIVVLPGGCTSKAQPVDVSLNRPIKDTMRGLWEEFMTSSMAHNLVSEIPTPTKDDVVDWIVRVHALLDSQPECVAKSFKVCGISDNLKQSRWVRTAWFTVQRNFLPSPYHMVMMTAMKTSSKVTATVLVTVMMKMRSNN